MQGNKIRAKFLDFFKRKGHLIRPSSPLAAEEEGLLFTIAGMVPFKSFFLGEKEPPASRIATCQLCLRTNDLEKVGQTSYHHTFFEMLGNFSFGDYFKDEACQWALEFITRDLGIPRERLWVTIFKEDEQAASIWKKLEFPPSRIVRKGEDENFWAAAEVGPCGPDSEIFFDKGESFGCPGGCDPGCDNCSRWIEIWNLVFMQYNRAASGKLSPLPSKNVDTGMGLERVATVLQGVSDDFHTNLFSPLYDWIKQISPTQPRGEKPLRVISDHVRGLVFLLEEGILPSNVGRGYVVRRILRRAFRYGRRMGLKDPFLYRGVPVVVDIMGQAYPNIAKKQKEITQVIKREEENFQITLSRGLSILDNMVGDIKTKGQKILPGQMAFKMYDTYGFPLDLTREITAEAGLNLDEEGFVQCMEEQRRKARASFAQGGYEKYDTPFIRQLEEKCPPHKGATFLGYDKLSLEVDLLVIVKDTHTEQAIAEGEEAEVVLSETPFYPEGGGQVPDTGQIISPTVKAEVFDVQKKGNLILHHIKVSRGELKQGDKVEAKVDDKRRLSIARSHTATHLLQAALRRFLGEDVRQSGSLVEAERLRFDFTYPSAVDEETLRRVCFLVNQKIREDIPLLVHEMSLEEAQEKGAIALFEEKYQERVRVVEVVGFSTEVCGGTHLSRTGQIGVFQIVSETGVAAGVRRIEAVCGQKALLWLMEKGEKLTEVARILSTSEDKVIERLKQREQQFSELKDRSASYQEKLLDIRLKQASSRAQNIAGVKVCTASFEDVSPQSLRKSAEKLRDKLGEAVVSLASLDKKKAFIVLASTRKDLPANRLIKEVSALAGGSGGGRWDFAQGGTSHPDRLEEALGSLPDMVKEMIKEREKNG